MADDTTAGRGIPDDVVRTLAWGKITYERHYASIDPHDIIQLKGSQVIVLPSVLTSAKALASIDPEQSEEGPSEEVPHPGR